MVALPVDVILLWITILNLSTLDWKVEASNFAHFFENGTKMKITSTVDPPLILTIFACALNSKPFLEAPSELGFFVRLLILYLLTLESENNNWIRNETIS